MLGIQEPAQAGVVCGESRHSETPTQIIGVGPEEYRASSVFIAIATVGKKKMAIIC